MPFLMLPNFQGMEYIYSTLLFLQTSNCNLELSKDIA
jgi:hypothetical protein